MKTLTIKQVAFFGVLFFGWALVAGAGPISINVATGSSQDSLQIGFSETLTQNVANVSGIGWVNEIDINLTSIGGTYLNGANVIPSTTGINNIEGTFTAVGGVLYLAASKGSPSLSLTVNGASNSPTGAAQIGGAANAAYSEMDFDTIGPAPTLAAPGALVSGSTAWWAATSLTGGWYTTFQNLNIMAPDPTPGGTWGVGGTPSVPTGYGFNNTLLAAFYVSPSTTAIKFYTDDGNPWNVNNSTGGYGLMGFNYGGGRTDYVSIMPSPEPATIVLLATSLVGLLAYAWRKRR